MFVFARRLMLRTIAVAAFFIGSTSAQASTLNVEMSGADLLGLIENVHLEMIDEVADGCWTDVSNLRAHVMSILAGSGINVAQVQIADSALHPALVISARGGRAEGGFCIVQAEVLLTFVTHSRFASTNQNRDVTVVSYDSRTNMFRINVAAVSSENVNTEVGSWVGQVVTALATEIASKRQDPNLGPLRQRLGLSN